MATSTASINIEYNGNENNSKFQKSEEHKSFPTSKDIRKEITKFNSKQELKNKMKNNKNKKYDRNNSEENIQTLILDMPGENENVATVKNKVIVLNSNYKRYDIPSNSNLNSVKAKRQETNSMKSTNKNGFLYTTHTIKKKFSNPNFLIEQVMRRNLDKMSTQSEMNNGENLPMDHNIRVNEPQNEFKMINSENLVGLQRRNLSADNFENMQPILKKGNKLNKNTNYNPYQTAATLYTMLNRKKNEFLEHFEMNQNFKNNSEQLLYQKKKFFKYNAMTHYMDQKGKDEIPFIFPIAWTHQNQYSNYSEQKRYEKITELFLKLKYFIEKDEENEKKYIKEFMMKNGIYEDKYYTIDRLNNFMNFLNSKLQIDPKKTLQQIIIDATTYELDDKSRPSTRKIPTSNAQDKNNHTNQLNKINSKRKIIGEKLEVDNKFSMSSYLSKPQPILDQKRFKLDLNNPKLIVDDLETEFYELNNGNGGLNFNVNESNLSHKKQKKHKTQSIEDKQNKHKFNNQKSLTQHYTLPQNKLRTSDALNKDSSNTKRNLPKLNIEEIRKKNKLLEYIVLQRSKNKLQLQQEMNKYQINDL